MVKGRRGAAEPEDDHEAEADVARRPPRKRRTLAGPGPSQTGPTTGRPGHRPGQPGANRASPLVPDDDRTQDRTLRRFPVGDRSTGPMTGQPGHRPGQTGPLAGQPGHRPGLTGPLTGQPGHQPGLTGRTTGSDGNTPPNCLDLSIRVPVRPCWLCLPI